MTGADATGGDANVWTYSTAGQSWSALTNISTASQTAGAGFLVYVYQDANFDGDTSEIGGPIDLSRPAELVVLCRNMEQVRAALTFSELTDVIVDFLEVKGLREAVELIQSTDRRAIVASPRVLKPSEERLVGFLVKLGADAILVRSLGLLHSLATRRGEDKQSTPLLFGDFSLNAANRPTVELLGRAGLQRLAMSHDLNRNQLCNIAYEGAENLEFIIHHHLPIFHTEHCVFARFLSDGDNKENCGRPCERHVLHLQSRDGKQHLVEADVGCRNTVFNAEAQSGVAEFQHYLNSGFRTFRLELVDHSALESREVIRNYLDVLAGLKSPDESWEELRGSRFGASRGSLKNTRSILPDEMRRPGWIKWPRS
jgi:collagenase-like PrtC family protease